MPPAEKLGTGSLPVLATMRTELVWGLVLLGGIVELVVGEDGEGSESRGRSGACAGRRGPRRRCRPRPWCGSYAAPSAIRRRASPRSRAPHTNGVVKACLSM